MVGTPPLLQMTSVGFSPPSSCWEAQSLPLIPSLFVSTLFGIIFKKKKKCFQEDYFKDKEGFAGGNKPIMLLMEEHVIYTWVFKGGTGAPPLKTEFAVEITRF